MKNWSNKQKKQQILALCFGLSLLLTSAANNVFAQDVTLEWDISPSPDITLYNVYITDVETNKTWQELGPIHDPSSNVVSYKVLGLDGTHQICFSVTAFNNSGLESAHSNQVCKAAVASYPVASYPVTDVDKDGFDAIAFGGKDCNDAIDAIHPGATDVCGDNIDQDCSNGDAICPLDSSKLVDSRNVDNDGDGYTENQNDCNDTVAAINPAAAERCADSIDNNCDGLTDGQDTATCPAPSTTCHDADQDGFFSLASCNTAPDCNDNDGQIKPGAKELCGDAIDNDCDGNIDEDCDIADSDGATIYENKCASCHGELPNSNVIGERDKVIMKAIGQDIGGMSSLSSLTDGQVKMIADTLSSGTKSGDVKYGVTKRLFRGGKK